MTKSGFLHSYCAHHTSEMFQQLPQSGGRASPGATLPVKVIVHLYSRQTALIKFGQASFLFSSPSEEVSEKPSVFLLSMFRVQLPIASFLRKEVVSRSGLLVALTRGSSCGEFCEVLLHLNQTRYNSRGSTVAETGGDRDCFVLPYCVWTTLPKLLHCVCFSNP